MYNAKVNIFFIGGKLNERNITYTFNCMPLVFVAGFIDSAAGGGGLISLPAYMAAGIPPHIATGTNKCSSMFGTFFSAWTFFKSGKIHIKAALVSAAAALFGSWVGAMLNMIASDNVLRLILMITLPVVAVFIIFKKDSEALTEQTA